MEENKKKVKEERERIKSQLMSPRPAGEASSPPKHLSPSPSNSSPPSLPAPPIVMPPPAEPAKSVCLLAPSPLHTLFVTPLRERRDSSVTDQQSLRVF